MKIVILSTNDISGGAAIAAYRLFKGLEKVSGIEAKMIVREKRSNDPNVIELKPDHSPFSKAERFFKSKQRFKRLDALKNQHYIPWFSDNFSDVDLSKCRELQDCDVINVHWTSEFVPLAEVLDQFPDKKVVVTLHDEHHFTGGCHYDLGCDKYLSKCEICPQAKKLNIRDNTDKVFKHRRSSYQIHSFDVVVLSSWLENKARGSRLYREHNIHKIFNGLPLDEWKQYDKFEAREKLKLPVDEYLVLSGSVNPINFVKGGDLLNKIQNLTPSKISDRKVTNFTFGNKNTDLDENVLQYGFVEDQKTMNLLYAAADLFCITSRYDNLPNTVLESMSSGTPVIGFNIGGVPDMIVDGVTGSLVEPLDVQKFSDKIVKLLSKSIEQRSLISRKARKRVEEEFSIHKQVESYVELFQTK